MSEMEFISACFAMLILFMLFARSLNWLCPEEVGITNEELFAETTEVDCIEDLGKTNDCEEALDEGFNLLQMSHSWAPSYLHPRNAEMYSAII